jgi:hypothetical protein
VVEHLSQRVLGEGVCSGRKFWARGLRARNGIGPLRP